MSGGSLITCKRSLAKKLLVTSSGGTAFQLLGVGSAAANASSCGMIMLPNRSVSNTKVRCIAAMTNWTTTLCDSAATYAKKVAARLVLRY
jgi:hypothetical protein